MHFRRFIELFPSHPNSNFLLRERELPEDSLEKILYALQALHRIVSVSLVFEFSLTRERELQKDSLEKILYARDISYR